jgi:hypothetical protein
MVTDDDGDCSRRGSRRYVPAFHAERAVGEAFEMIAAAKA